MNTARVLAFWPKRRLHRLRPLRFLRLLFACIALVNLLRTSLHTFRALSA